MTMLIQYGITLMQQRSAIGYYESKCSRSNLKRIAYISLSYRQNTGQNDDMKAAGRCFVDVAMLSYLGATITEKIAFEKKRMTC
jgi:hypothetical protein